MMRAIPDQCVSGEECGHELLNGAENWVGIGGDDSQDAHGPSAHRASHRRMRLLGQQRPASIHKEIDRSHCRGRLEPGFPERFSHFSGDDFGQGLSSDME